MKHECGIFRRRQAAGKHQLRNATCLRWLGPAPEIDDLKMLTDHVGGRVTGTPANEAAVDWAVQRFESAGVVALVWGFANSDERLPRQSCEDVEQLVEGSNLEHQMRNFGVWKDWESGSRGRQP